MDDDCDGVPDDGIVAPVLYEDLDGDGYGNSAASVQSCTPAAGHVGNSTDCDDGNPAVNPDATEICNGIDDDCNLAIDDGIAAPIGLSDLRLTKVAGTTLNWSVVAAATNYDIVKGDWAVLSATGGDFTSGTLSCLADNVATASATDASTPPTSNGFWYVVRPLNYGGTASYDSGSPFQAGSRDLEIAASAGACP